MVTGNKSDRMYAPQTRSLTKQSLLGYQIKPKSLILNLSPEFEDKKNVNNSTFFYFVLSINRVI